VSRLHHLRFAWHLTVRAYRLATWAVLLAALAIGCVLLGLRYWLLPSIDDHRDWIQSTVSRAAQQRITIARVAGSWTGARPRLVLDGVVVHDAQDRPVLALSRVDAVLGWRSLLRGDIRFRALVVSRPDLTIRRDPEGRLFIAGIPVVAGAEGGGFTDWLLAQREIQIDDARVTWVDEQRGAPAFRVVDVDLRLQKRGARHRVGASALLPPEVGGRVEFRGDLQRDWRRGLEGWSGQLHARTSYVNLRAVEPWIDLPMMFESGTAELEAWVGLSDGGAREATVDLRLAGLRVRLAPELPHIDVAQAQGRFTFGRTADGLEVSARRFGLVLPDGATLPPTDLRVRYRPAGAARPAATQIEAAGITMAPLVTLARGLPLDAALRDRLRGLRAGGRMDDVHLEWTGALPRPERYAATAKLTDVTLRLAGNTPGVEGVSGRIRADENGGQAELRGNPLALVLPGLFEEPLRFDSADARVAWRLRDGRLSVEIAKASFGNADLSGSLAGTYESREGGPGVANLRGVLARLDAASAHRYVPRVAGEGTRAWLRSALAGGAATDVRFTLRGDLSQFPFDRTPDAGLFEVVSRLDGVRLQYAPGWPAVEGATGTMEFRGRGMRIEAQAGVAGVEIPKATATIKDLIDPQAVLEIRGDARGPTSAFLRFVDASPVGDMIGGLARDLRAEGGGVLGLQLDIPLSHPRDTAVEGSYRFVRNRLFGHAEIPPMHDLDATLRFTHRGAELANANVVLFDGPATFGVSVDAKGGVRIMGSGRATPAGLRKSYETPWLAFAEGETDWKATASLRAGRFDLTVESTLAGLALKLPPPLAKPAAQVLPLRVQRRSGTRGDSQIQVSLGRILSAAMLLESVNGRTRVARGAVDFGTAAKLPARPGVTVSGRIDRVEVDEWLDVLQATKAPEAEGAQPDAAGDAVFDVVQVGLEIREFEAFDRTLNGVALDLARREATWRGRVSSREVEGTVEWVPEGRGRLSARLARLHVPDVVPGGGAAEPAESVTGRDLPAIDVSAQSFRFGKLDLGSLVLRATQNGPAWQVDRLELDNPDGRLTVQGGWQTVRGRPNSQFAIRLEAGNIGGLFKRLGRPEAIVGGTATLAGAVSWEGAPYRVDIPTLSGRLQLQARKGRFSKLEPGIGKLLGVFSLQSLPRRLTFDFRDIFAQGFSFDDIEATADIVRGTMRLEEFRMTGTQARVRMKGELDLVGETQSLDLRVVPSISDTVAIGTALVNPAIGLATLLAGRALNNPMDQVVAVDYRITGPWDDPQVARVGRGQTPPQGQGDKGGN
jgi:uncharacterized protein (TIGR02099 family)